jgi:predicted ferric reductase
MADPEGTASSGIRARAHRVVTATAVAALAMVPLVLALTDFHLSAAPSELVLSTGAGALAVSALALQPFLAARAGARSGAAGRRRLRWHRVLGTVVLGLVLAHVGALFLVEVDDTLFAMSPDGPTRARMALIALIALIATVILGATYRRLTIRAGTWRILHLYFAVVFIVLGVGHAVLTDGALDELGTPVLVAFGALGLVGAFRAHRMRRRGGRRLRGRTARSDGASEAGA